MYNRLSVLEVLQYVFLCTAVVSGGIGAYLLLSGSGSNEEEAGDETPDLVVRPKFGKRSASFTATVQW